MSKPKKKKSGIEIGADHETEYEQMMIVDGWMTYRPPKGNRWEKNKDIFNKFDILGFKSQKIRLTQVKTRNLEGCVEEIREWAIKNRANIPDNVEIEVALKKYATKRKLARWRIYQIPLDEGQPIMHYDVGVVCKGGE